MVIESIGKYLKEEQAPTPETSEPAQAERPKFEKKSLEQLLQESDQRAAKRAESFASFRRSLAEKPVVAFAKKFGSKTSEILKETWRVLRAAPELGEYAKDFTVNAPSMVKEKATEIGQKVGDGFKGAVEKAGVVLSEKGQAIMERAGSGFNSLEQRGIEAFANLQVRYEDALTKARGKRDERQKILDEIQAHRIEIRKLKAILAV